MTGYIQSLRLLIYARDWHILTLMWRTDFDYDQSCYRRFSFPLITELRRSSFEGSLLTLLLWFETSHLVLKYLQKIQNLAAKESKKTIFLLSLALLRISQASVICRQFTTCLDAFLQVFATSQPFFKVKTSCLVFCPFLHFEHLSNWKEISFLLVETKNVWIWPPN